MASSIGTGLPNLWETRIESIVFVGDESDNTRRVFDITTTEGTKVTCSATVPRRATMQSVDNLFHNMRQSVCPCLDLKDNTERLTALWRSYMQLPGLSETQQTMLATAAEEIADTNERLSCATRIRPYGVPVQAQVALQRQKLRHLDSAKRWYNAAARTLTDFVQLEDLRQRGIISVAKMDTDLEIIERGVTMFIMWKNAFQVGLFV